MQGSGCLKIFKIKISPLVFLIFGNIKGGVWFQPDKYNLSSCIKDLPIIFINNMKIFGAVALGLTIIILKILMPDVFLALTNTILTFFRVLNDLLSVIGQHNSSATVFLPQIQRFKINKNHASAWFLFLYLLCLQKFVYIF